MRKDLTWGWLILLVVLLALVGSAVYSLVALFSSGPSRGDHLVHLGQCLVGIAVMFLPSLFERRLHIAIPGRMYIIYVVFLFAALYLGEVQRFYERVPYWDKVLHAFSGITLGALGFSLVSLLNDSDRVKVSLSPLFVAVFAFCFALALGAIWEIYEFTMDSAFGLNMQRYAEQSGKQLVGNDALIDTMGDLIVDAIGALVTCVAGYISLKRGSTWLEKLALRHVSPPARSNKGRAP
jgi:uncharacterized membrane protein YjdF